jgi:site-specific DNA recombinase
MMMQLRQGIGDTVVIYDQSRMFRKMTAWFAFRDELTAMGVKVISVTQPMIGKDLRDPTNFLTEGSMALFNQIWALQSRQKTMEKMRFMARNGQHTGGKPALGYVVKDGRLEICEEEAAIVRRIFREYADGCSYREIIAGLNRDGLKTKRGNAFGSNSLHDMLHNEKYMFPHQFLMHQLLSYHQYRSHHPQGLYLIHHSLDIGDLPHIHRHPLLQSCNRFSSYLKHLKL